MLKKSGSYSKLNLNDAVAVHTKSEADSSLGDPSNHEKESIQVDNIGRNIVEKRSQLIRDLFAKSQEETKKGGLKPCGENVELHHH